MNVHAKVRTLDLQRLSADRMVDEAGVRNALKYLEHCLDAPDANTDVIIQDLLLVPNLFAYVMSVWPRASELSETIISSFPTETDLLLNSYAGTLLTQTTQLLFSFPPELFSTEISRRIGRNRVYVEGALSVLNVMATRDFSDAGNTKPTGRKSEQHGSTIYSTPFKKFGVNTPSSTVEAERLSKDILLDFKEILQFILNLLLLPDLASSFKAAYFLPMGNQAKEVQVRAREPELPRSNSEVASSIAPAYPAIQPLKAALYFDNADGFGEWRILISDDATRRLREIRNSDKKKFRIVVKKIKQLSNGHFSDDNQKRLNGPSSGVPVFEAKMQRDLRLVYQVDCVPGRGSDVMVERQVIRIYGVYTHTQLNRIWDSVGQFLASKGKEYRHRCTFRCPAPRSGNDVYVPASFPSSVPQCDRDPMETLPASSGDELHSLLVLGKYVAFSQAFLNALIANEDVQHVFELSPHEYQIIECSNSCYVLGRSGTGKTTTMLFKMLGIQRAWEQSPELPKPRQMFVTKSHVLAEKVEKYFKKHLASLVTAAYSLEELSKLKAHDANPSLDANENGSVSQNRIPQSYSALMDHHFPLFITFDNLANMIAADIFNTDRHHERYSGMLFQSDAPGTFVTYKLFAKTYWPHFPQHLTKGLDPWLVFSEFMGIIKGSEQSLAFIDGFLDQETYCGLSARSYPTFSNQREMIYSLFEAYRDLKRERRHHDMADRTHTILKALPGTVHLKGQPVDYVYVDEAQDNLLIDALVLRQVCRNPDGLFWAGDTAQTISAGSSFRLDDLKAFLHRVEEDQNMNTAQERKPIPPTTFQLAINYRSHGGIINCANSVVELIMQLWPYAIDKLQPERGIVDGSKPIFIDGWDDVTGYEEFVFGGSESHIEFGADQCILVRDDEVKEKLLHKLRKQVGKDDIGLIMTLYDSKGLEFNDILLYNFFESSTAHISQWRIMLSALEERESKGHAAGSGIGETKYGGICSELKHLYVGITRARQRLWIVDESTKSEPMRTFWISRSLVERCSLRDASTRLAHLAVSSTPEKWAARGHQMLQHEKYAEAKLCFAKAGLPHECAIAEAYELREDAFNTPPGKARKGAFRIAADKLTNCANNASADEHKIKYHYVAANCYDNAEDNDRAVSAFVNARGYDRAARQYHKANLFDRTVEFLHEYSSKMSSECYEQLFEDCRYFYCSQDIESPFPLFSSVDEKLEFLDVHGLHVARAKCMESLARFSEAAELYLTLQQPIDAIKAFLKDAHLPHAIKRAADTLLKCLRPRCSSFAISPTRVAKDKHVNELLTLADNLLLDRLDPVVRDEICLFQSIAHADMSTLENLAVTFTKSYGRDTLALLAFDTRFAHPPPLESATVQQMLAFLDKFHLYAQLLYQIIVCDDPLLREEWLQLFRISKASSDEYTIEQGSPLYRFVSEDMIEDQQATIPSTSRQVTAALRRYLSAHLHKRLSAEHSACCKSTLFSRCLAFAVNGVCDQECSLQHTLLSSFHSKQYNAHVDLHLKQTFILRFMMSTSRHAKLPPATKSGITGWLDRLYEAIFPPFYVQGTIADLDRSSIRNKLWILKKWIRAAVYSLDPPGCPDEFLAFAIRLMKLSVTFDDDGDMQYLKEAHWMVHNRLPAMGRSAGSSCILENMLTFMEGREPRHISAGVNALHFMLQNSLCVKPEVLCDFAEDVCSSIVISLRLETSNGPLHDIILPRSWLTRPERFAAAEKVDCIGLFIESVQLLLKRVRSDGVEDVFRLRSTPVTLVHRNVFTSRICRMLCFLRQIPTVKDDVSRVLSSLNGDLHPFYSKYVETPAEKYLQTLRLYDDGLRVKDLAHLVHSSKMRCAQFAGSTPPYLQRIVYENPTQIPGRLATQYRVFPPPRTPFVPQTIYASKVTPIKENVRHVQHKLFSDNDQRSDKKSEEKFQ